MKSPASSRLVEWMEEHELSPAAFAAVVDANRSQIYRLTTGERGPSIHLARRIEEATEGAVKATEWATEKRRTETGRGSRSVAHRGAARGVHGSTVAR